MILANRVSVSFFLITTDPFSLAGKTHFTLSLRGVWMELILSLTPRSAGDPGQANQRIPFRWSQSLVQRWAHDSGRAREGQVAIFVGIAGKEKDSANRLSS